MSERQKMQYQIRHIRDLLNSCLEAYARFNGTFENAYRGDFLSPKAMLEFLKCKEKLEVVLKNAMKEFIDYTSDITYGLRDLERQLEYENKKGEENEEEVIF